MKTIRYAFVRSLPIMAGYIVVGLHLWKKNTLLSISEDLYTPLFAIARVPGWCAHRVEEVEFANRIIRPAYKYLGKPQEYVPLEKR